MAAEDFQLIDDTITDISILEKDFAEKYQQQIAQVNEVDKIGEIFFG